MKYEWRKQEKTTYLPTKKPSQIALPAFKYFTINGSGNPNGTDFSECVEALYALSYAIRMSHKKGLQPDGFYEYTVYPLEGVWDISDKAKASFDGTIDKDELVYQLMIRQPDFVSKEYAAEVIARTQAAKPNLRVNDVSFTEITEGSSVQMMHIGSYDDEPASFAKMAEFCEAQGLVRTDKKHKEIYISDPRKVAEEKRKTVLRFPVN